MDPALSSVSPEALELEVDERILITSREQPQPNDGNCCQHIETRQNDRTPRTPGAPIPRQIYRHKAQHRQADPSQIPDLKSNARHR